MTFLILCCRLYFATASKYVRPKQIYKVHFELLYMPYGTLQIQATLIQNDKEYATTVTTFKTVGAKLIELQVPLHNICMGYGIV
jgi:hypothetical protein